LDCIKSNAFANGEHGDIYRIKGMGRKLLKLELQMIDKQLLPYRSIGGKKMD
jgi:hypothetical protein